MKPNSILAAFVIYLSVGFVLACKADESAPLLQEAVKHQAEIFSKIYSVDSRASKVSRLGPEFAPAHSPREFPGSIHYREDGNKFVYDIDLVSLNGGRELSSIVAFDGTHLQRYQKEDGWLTLAKGDVASDPILQYKHFLWLPYFFLSEHARADASHSWRLADLKSDTAWLALGSKAKEVSDARSGSHACLRFSIPGGKSPTTGMETSFEVFLARDLAFFPVEWRRKDVNGKTILSYKVEEIGKAVVSGGESSVFYPKKAVSVAYDEGNPTKILTTLDALISEVAFNTPMDSDVFTIDPSMARNILDADANTVIQVPK